MTAPSAIQPRPFSLRRTLVVLAALAGFFAFTSLRADRPDPSPAWSGETMGTTYSVKIAGSRLTRRQLENVKKAVDDALREVNRRMSHYQPDSELSRFNAATSTEPFAVSPSFARVVRFALELSEKSGGMFDPTLGPLINLWGFGPAGRIGEPPSAERVAETLKTIGARHLSVTADGELRKDIPGLQLNLSAVAKGYGADEAARVLTGAGWSNVFVEVGGEVVAFGRNAKGGKWRIGIERPNPKALPGEDLEAVIEVSDLAVATSGDYRNFFEDSDGNVYSHILDPREGRPVRHAAASVTVVAPSCLAADGLATTLFVLGPEEGLKFIEAWPDAEALFIVHGKDDSFSEIASSGFEGRTGYRAGGSLP